MSATSQSMQDRLEQARKQFQAQKEKEAAEQKALDKRAPKVIGEDRRVPVTRQAIYGDLEKEETARAMRGAGTKDILTKRQKLLDKSKKLDDRLREQMQEYERERGKVVGAYSRNWYKHGT